MDGVLTVLVVYVFLQLLLRLAGRRTLSELSPFDLVMLLVLSELVQNAIVQDDQSLTGAIVLCTTIVGLDVGLTLLKRSSPWLDRVLEGVPVVLVDHGRPIADRMHRARVDQSDILAAARITQGLERMDQIRYAVLEKSGGISIVPEPPGAGGGGIRGGVRAG